MTKIFITYHKEYPVISSGVFVPVQAGAAIAGTKLQMTGDNTGDNISSKNRTFCELTVQYWAWKNVKEDSYGFFHYRRFLDLKGDISELCRKYDILLPKKTLFLGRFWKRQTVKEHWASYHNKVDLDIVLRIIGEKYPEYMRSAEEFMNDKSAYCFNIFIMKDKIFQEYMQWLFDILFEAEKRIKVSGDDYQKRIFGFLGERLLNIFVKNITKNKDLRIKELKTIQGKF